MSSLDILLLMYIGKDSSYVFLWYNGSVSNTINL